MFYLNLYLIYDDRITSINLAIILYNLYYEQGHNDIYEKVK